MFDTHKKSLPSELLSARIDSSGQNFVLVPGDGEAFADNMPVTLCPPNVQPTVDNSEIGYLTSVDGGTLTITRAQEGSVPMQVAAGWKLPGSLTGESLKDIETAVESKADTADLAPVATSGSYADLANRLALPDISGKADKTFSSLATWSRCSGP